MIFGIKRGCHSTSPSLPACSLADVRVCERSAAGEQGDLAAQDMGDSPCPAAVCLHDVYLCCESVCVCWTEQEVRQTDMSLTQNILQTLSIQPPPLPPPPPLLLWL